jgi:hypothetical protein
MKIRITTIKESQERKAKALELAILRGKHEIYVKKSIAAQAMQED